MSPHAADARFEPQRSPRRESAGLALIEGTSLSLMGLATAAALVLRPAVTGGSAAARRLGYHRSRH
ncbi:hypothetical protein [Nocardioides acrostichi]|uniref:Uncharacterized protein n=1 Tax=Nocardioides acrostichi TaxID=2784339 RepID=A0A930UWB6_9ACTN|nr:hypothetical protein [Nocardioides acrostichi]MBF4160857.1 hypothetical protein [Nocardioides acrostichi]